MMNAISYKGYTATGFLSVGWQVFVTLLVFMPAQLMHCKPHSTSRSMTMCRPASNLGKHRKSLPAAG